MRGKVIPTGCLKILGCLSEFVCCRYVRRLAKGNPNERRENMFSNCFLIKLPDGRRAGRKQIPTTRNQQRASVGVNATLIRIPVGLLLDEYGDTLTWGTKLKKKK